jgi:hypothetical protein
VGFGSEGLVFCSFSRVGSVGDGLFGFFFCSL